MTREESLEFALLEKEEELSLLRIERDNLSNEIEVQRGKIEFLQEQISWMSVNAKNEQQAKDLLSEAMRAVSSVQVQVYTLLWFLML